MIDNFRAGSSKEWDRCTESATSPAQFDMEQPAVSRYKPRLL
jgi:hypothetical protein